MGSNAPRPARPGPVIESIELDKTEVCAGEENFATVKAHDASGGTESLIVTLAGTRELGFRLPFRLEPSNANRPRFVKVSGGGGPPVMGQIPNVTLKDCSVEQLVGVDVGLDPSSPHVLTLTAKLSEREATNRAAPRRGFVPRHYEWDFGDGSKQTTTSAEVEHSYEGKPQTARYSYFLIKVKVRGADGGTLEGSRAYGFANFGYGAFVEDRRVALFAAGASAPGEVPQKRDGEQIRLYHGYQGPVHLESVASRDVLTEGGSRREIPGPRYAARELLGIDQLPPGAASTTRDLAALRPTELGRLRVLELYGHANGMEARGRIVLTATTKAPAPPVEEAIEDPTATAPL